MTTTSDLIGKCLCGAVSYEAKAVDHEAGICHCSMCRRWSGGPLMAVSAKGSVRFSAEENITRFRSSQWAERGFCAKCGSNLFYHLIEADQYMLMAGSLDDQSVLSLTHQVFIDEKPGWYAFANQTRNMTGEEVFARYAPKDGA